jgi:surface antigen
MKIFQKFLIISSAIVIIAGTPFQLADRAFADQFDDQISELQRQADAFQAEATRLNNAAKTLQSAIAAIVAEKAQIQIQINISQSKYDQLVQEIDDTEKKIADNKDALGLTIANMYVEDNTTPVEILFGSKNISDYMDKQEYRNSVRDQLTSTISEIKTLKAQLDQQRLDVEKVLAQQKSQKDSLVAKEVQQQTLLDQTKGQEAAYQQLVSNNQQRMDDIAAQQRAYYQSLIKNGVDTSYGVYGDFSWRNLSPNNGAGGCSGGYPYCGPQDSMVDPWQLYNRECVSYAAWALENRFGKYVGGFNGQGNAEEWVYSAPRFSGAYRVYSPQPGDAVVLPASSFAPVGHLMIVESVGDDGWVHISQYNMYGTGQYSTMDIKTSGVVFLRFQDA